MKKQTIIIIIIVVILLLFINQKQEVKIVTDFEQVPGLQSVISTRTEGIYANNTLYKGSQYTLRSLIAQRSYEDIKGLQVDFFWAVGDCFTPAACEYKEQIGTVAASSVDSPRPSVTNNGQPMSSFEPGTGKLDWITSYSFTSSLYNFGFDDDYIHLYTTGVNAPNLYEVEYPAFDHADPPAQSPTVTLNFPNKYCGRNDFGIVANHYYYNSGSWNFQEYFPYLSYTIHKYTLGCSCTEYKSGVDDIVTEWGMGGSRVQALDMLSKWVNKC